MKTILDNPQALDLGSRAQQHIYRLSKFLPFFASNRPYNLTICNEKMFVWFRVAKVCTRTIYRHLSERVTLDVNHPYRVYYRPRAYRSFFKFAFVRNPWDRLVSCWQSKVIRSNYFNLSESDRTKMTRFEYFVEYASTLNLERCDCHLRLQSASIDLNHVDFIGRFENFTDDMNHVCESVGIPVEGLAHRNKSVREPYQTYYDAELADRVHRLYAKDIRLFGYSYG